MRMIRIMGVMLAGLAAMMGAAAAEAQITWTDWTSQTDATTVVGTVAGIGVTYSGSIYFSQTDGTGTDYWNTCNSSCWSTTPATTPPPGTDIIALANGGPKTITFASPVQNVYLALTSWNGNVVTFDHAFTTVGIGCGYWGCGTITANATNTGFTGNGEVHGILEFAGPITSLSFTDTDESWHGFQIGVDAISTAVPEPASWAMMVAGFGLAGAALRRRRETPALA